MIFRLLLCFFSTSLFANVVYNPKILDIQAKVFPKIIISDNDFEKKLIDNKIVLTLFYEEIDLNTAQSLKEKIEKNYEILKDLPFEVNLQKYSDFRSDNLSTAYLFLLGKKENITQISNILEKNSRLSFAYDDSYLDFGVIFALKISAKIDIFLNLQALKNSEIELQNSIFNVVKIR
ncbi:hypothetical protein [Arcobacter vandammei]|uniref:hypothetical protein n=1 Tax=Arcobacter vandammei TaxID=2782243 RepID=UPI0018E03352|nr:hypothetical protein [Arcobacter vandammei]